MTSSISATKPTPYETTYGPSRAFVYMFAEALRAEVLEHGITVTALLPGATDSDFHVRAGMGDTKFGDNSWKNDKGVVARQGVDALFAGKDVVVGGDRATKRKALLQRLLPERVKGGAARPRRSPHELSFQPPRPAAGPAQVQGLAARVISATTPRVAGAPSGAARSTGPAMASSSSGFPASASLSIEERIPAGRPRNRSATAAGSIATSCAGGGRGLGNQRVEQVRPRLPGRTERVPRRRGEQRERGKQESLRHRGWPRRGRRSRRRGRRCAATSPDRWLALGARRRWRSRRTATGARRRPAPAGSPRPPPSSAPQRPGETPRATAGRARPR